MRICLYGNFVVPYCTEVHHAISLESLGHTVIRLQETEVFTDRVLKESSRADLLVWVHTHGVLNRGNLPMAHVLSELRRHKIPTVGYHLDLFRGIEARWANYQRDVYLTALDHFFTVDGPLAEWMNGNPDIPTTGHYLPAGVLGAECYLAEPGPVRRDVIFVGSERYHPEWPYRQKLIGWLRAQYKDRFVMFGQDAGRVVRGKDLNQLYADARIVVGDTFCPGFTYGPYWSDRVYETLGRGGFLIHPRVPGIDTEFIDGEHLVLYDFDDAPGLKGLIDHYLGADAERERIRLAGHNYVKDHYTYRHRWEHILKELGK